MTLLDGFKVEREPVPQRELSRGRAADEPLGLGRPFDHVHGAPHLRQGAWMSREK